MNRKQALIFLLLAVLCVFAVGQTLGQTRTPGVNADDTFVYITKAYWYSNNSQSSVPGELLSWNQTQSYEITVSYVTGTNVTTDEFWSFINGTSRTTVVSQDITSGTNYFMWGAISENIVCANLEKGDSLYSSGNDLRRINETVIVDYGTVERETNSVSFSQPILDEFYQVVGVINRVDYYDKETGMLVGRYENTVAPGEDASIAISVAQTNRWAITQAASIVTQTPDETPQSNGFNISLPVLAGIITAVVLAAIVVPLFVYRSRRNRKKRYRR